MVFVKNFQRSKGSRSSPIPENDMKKGRHPQSNRSQLSRRRMSHKEKLVIAVREKTRQPERSKGETEGCFSAGTAEATEG